MTFRNPFKQHHGAKRTAISKTAEREFERDIKKVEQLDEDSRKIHKDTKRCVDSQAAQAKAENKVVQDLYNSALAREDPKLRFITDQWYQCSQQLDLLTQEMNTTSQKSVVEPMKKFSTIFPSLQQAVKKRDQLLQEYNKCQAKVDKYADKDRTGPNIVKLDASKKTLNQSKAEFDAQGGVLVEDVPKFYDNRIDYFQPSFQALMKSQLKYHTESHKIYSGLAECIGPQQPTEFSSPFSDNDEEISPQEDTTIQQKLAEIRSLAITIDDRPDNS